VSIHYAGQSTLEMQGGGKWGGVGGDGVEGRTSETWSAWDCSVGVVTVILVAYCALRSRYQVEVAVKRCIQSSP
jgi:hypothetical protein